MERLLDFLFKRIEIRAHTGSGWDGELYLIRWVVFDLLGWRLYIHRFVRPDHAREPHDHPNGFWSFGLKGHYIEHLDSGTRVWKAGTWHYMDEHQFHRVGLSKCYTDEAPANVACGKDERGPFYYKPCWTLVLMKKRIKSWGFRCSQGIRKWQDYYAFGGCD